MRRRAEKHQAPIAAEFDQTDRFPTERVKLYGEMGLMRLWMPEQHGRPEWYLPMSIARVAQGISAFVVEPRTMT